MPSRAKNCSSAVCLLAAILLLAVPFAVAQSQDVLTYHGDNLRTGWFSSESQLTASNVNSQSFGLLQTVVLDGRVDAEPLVVLQQTIKNQGVHDVVYVATENDSVYAIDANDGTILWRRSLGTPVPYQYKNYDDNVFPVMGILGTPVIDLNIGAIYVVADTYNGKTDSFHLHALSLSTGKDLLKAVTIHFSEQLQNGKTWTLNPRYHLQRPGLLEANGSIYVAFGSNGDTQPNKSRGTIVRYDAATLTQLNGQITNKLHRSTAYYLSSIWQSGYGPTSDQNGDVYFSTGNSDPNRPSYSKLFNRPDSMVHLSGDLTTLLDSFTTYNYFQLDQGDVDMGSGGMLLLPDQSGSFPHLSVAGGKDGRAFLLNRDNLGGYHSGGDKVLQTINMGSCWCGPAYFTGSDGVPRVLTGGSNGVTSWQLQTTPTTQLVQESSTGNAPVYGWPDNGGVLPVVSSNGTTAGSAVVWFVQRPQSSSDQDPGTPVTLWAFAATDLTTPLFSASAGTWTHAVNSNADLVPTVANDMVYVASNEQLQIFGLFTGHKAARHAVVPGSLIPSAPSKISCSPNVAPLTAIGGHAAPMHQFSGTVCQAHGADLQLALRGGHSILVDVGDAIAHHRSALLTPGRAVRVVATIDAKGAAHAQRVSPAHTISRFTPPDR